MSRFAHRYPMRNSGAKDENFLNFFLDDQKVGVKRKRMRVFTRLGQLYGPAVSDPNCEVEKERKSVFHHFRSQTWADAWVFRSHFTKFIIQTTGRQPTTDPV
jgi:hypothetical protein